MTIVLDRLIKHLRSFNLPSPLFFPLEQASKHKHTPNTNTNTNTSTSLNINTRTLPSTSTPSEGNTPTEFTVYPKIHRRTQ
jgi:hypothetical protein